MFSQLSAIFPADVGPSAPVSEETSTGVSILADSDPFSTREEDTLLPTSLRSVSESVVDESPTVILEDVLSDRTSAPSLDEAALEESAFDSPEELEAVSNEEPQVRDASLSRFSKRFRMSSRYMKLKKYESENLTYYPRDHVSDGQLWAVRKRLIDDEHSILNTLFPKFHDSLPLYRNFTSYLDTDEKAKIVSKSEMEKLQSLSGRAQSLYRKKLMTRVFKVLNKRHKTEKENRLSLMRRQVIRKGRYCEGCKIKTHFSIKPLNSHKLTLRKFVGNREVFTIYNSTFCRHFPAVMSR